MASNAVQMAQPATSHGAAGAGLQSTLMQGDPGRVVVQAPQRPIEPVFVAPPKQRVQRVMHSDIYLRYGTFFSIN